MPAKKTETPETFERALAELERIVAAMEAGELPLEESLAQYRRGVGLLKDCRARLDAAEQQIRILENGELTDYAGDTTDNKDHQAR